LQQAVEQHDELAHGGGQRHEWLLLAAGACRTRALRSQIKEQLRDGKEEGQGEVDGEP
jgi:hypothetical protein